MLYIILNDWFQAGLYNFRPSVRPVPLEVHIAGFPGKHYCPRMATMNKPTFQGYYFYFYLLNIFIIIVILLIFIITSS